MIDEYIECYDYSANTTSYYKYSTWLKIIDNLSEITSCEVETIEGIIKRYLKAKFKDHSLYHSSLENVLEKRLFEVM